VKAIRIFLTAALAIALAIPGCSHGTSPLNPGEAVPVEALNATSGNPHNLFGLYTFTCDPASGTVDIQPLRDAELHLNALHFLEPPPYVNVTLESKPKINGNILDIDIGLRHPFFGLDGSTAFDVCGILMTNGSVTGFDDPDLRMAGEGDTRLLNPDGYTRWWNPLEFPHGAAIVNYIDGMLGTPDSTGDYNCTLNAYKYFADGLEKDAPLTTLDPASRGVFSVGAKNVRHYKIDMSGGLIFNYAVDACWKKPEGKPPYNVPDDFPEGANQPEAWNVIVTELENTLYYSGPGVGVGGDLKLLIDVYDHFNAALNKISAESLSGLPILSKLTPIGGGEGYSTYQLDFTGGSLTKNGDAELLITVASEVYSYGKILLGKRISAYFVWHFDIATHSTAKGWARTWGGPSWDKGYGVATDGNSNVYVTGWFIGTVDFDPGSAVDEHTANSSYDIFLSKFDSNGEFQWARTLDGAGPEYGCAVAVDGSGNVYVAGGAGDVFLTKFDSNGEFQWTRTWGGEYADRGFGVAVDGSGNIYVTGSSVKIFLRKYNSNGEFQWSRTWGHYSEFIKWDNGYGVAVDVSGNVYVTGYFVDTTDFDPGPGVDMHKCNGGGELGDDVFLSKLNSNGEFQWARTWGWHDIDRGYAVAVDGSGNACVTGCFNGKVDFDPGPGVDEHTANDGAGAFFSKFDSNGEFLWAHTWGGSSGARGHGAATDGYGCAFITGSFSGAVDFDPGPGVDWHGSNGLSDIFLSKFDFNGEFLWARTWGEISQGDGGYGVAIDGSGNAYVTGDFLNIVDFDPGPGVDMHTSCGTRDIFLSKFPPDGNW